MPSPIDDTNSMLRAFEQLITDTRSGKITESQAKIELQARGGQLKLLALQIQYLRMVKFMGGAKRAMPILTDIKPEGETTTQTPN